MKHIFAVSVILIAIGVWCGGYAVLAQTPLTSKKSPIYSLSGPGNFTAINTQGYNWVTFAFWDSLVVTSATVQFMGGILGKAPLSGGSVDAEYDSTVFVGTSGTWYRKFNCAALDYVYLRLLTEAGGTSGVFKCVYRLENTEK